jgi:hypothetical protein
VLPARPSINITSTPRECTVGKHTQCSQESQQGMLGVGVMLPQEVRLLQGALERHPHGPPESRRPGGPFLARLTLPADVSDRLLGPETEVPERQRSDPISFCE